MSFVIKPVAGASLGVAIPLITEYAVKGKRLLSTAEEPTKGYKYSGILGLIEGFLGIGSAYYAHKTGKLLKKSEDVAMVAAIGGAGLTTGASILILDELRKRNLYTFKKGKSGGVPRKLKIRDGLQIPHPVEFPEEELVEEI